MGLLRPSTDDLASYLVHGIHRYYVLQPHVAPDCALLIVPPLAIFLAVVALIGVALREDVTPQLVPDGPACNLFAIDVSYNPIFNTGHIIDCGTVHANGR